MDLLTSSGQYSHSGGSVLCALFSLYLTGHGVGGLARSKLWENCVGGSGGGEWLQFHCLFTEMEQFRHSVMRNCVTRLLCNENQSSLTAASPFGGHSI